MGRQRRLRQRFDGVGADRRLLSISTSRPARRMPTLSHTRFDLCELMRAEEHAFDPVPGPARRSGEIRAPSRDPGRWSARRAPAAARGWRTRRPVRPSAGCRWSMSCPVCPDRVRSALRALSRYSASIPGPTLPSSSRISAPVSVRPQGDVGGHIRKVAMGATDVTGRGRRRFRALPALGRRRPEQHANRRRLARAIGAQEAEYLTRCDGQAQVVDGDDAAETLGQAVDADRRAGVGAAMHRRIRRARKPFTSRVSYCRPDFPAHHLGIYSRRPFRTSALGSGQCQRVCDCSRAARGRRRSGSPRSCARKRSAACCCWSPRARR